MSVVIDLDSRRQGPTALKSISHPAGVALPFEGPADAAFVIPEIRSQILSGAYNADLLTLLPDAVKPGDRVLVIGAGLGAASSLAARCRGVKRVIAVEANTELAPYLARSHALNGVPWVETVNAVMGHGVKGRVPFFARHDIRASSLLPDDCSWQLVMMVPCMELNLILTEERISLVVCELPAAAADLMAGAELGGVERVLVSGGDDAIGRYENAEVRAILAARGFEVEETGNALFCGRAKVGGEDFARANKRA